MQFLPSQVPSDNLYKFIAISGLSISVIVFLNFDVNYSWLYAVIIVVALLLGTIGFWLWYVRLQKIQDQMVERILEKEGLEIGRLKSEEKERMRKQADAEIRKSKGI